MASSDETTQSSSKSSPNQTRRFIPLHLLKSLPLSEQVIPTISDSESDDESVPLPTTYYVSPSRPDKRRHLTIPSPRMAQLSIQGPTRRFKPSIPGYGQGTKKVIRVSASRLTRSDSTSTAGSTANESGRPRVRGPILVSPHALDTPTTGSDHAIPGSQLEMFRPIPVSAQTSLFVKGGPTEENDDTLSQHGAPKCVQRLFVGPAHEDEGNQTNENSTQSSSPSVLAVSKFPIRRRVVLPSMRRIPMQYRELRSPIVVSDSNTSDSGEEDAAATKSIDISRVVSEILGRQELDASEASLFADPDVARSSHVDHGVDVGETMKSPPGFQEKEKCKDFSKKERDRIVRKDNVSKAKLASRKIKEISKYPCCDNLCLRKLGVSEVTKQRTYYYGLKASEKNILLRGCMEDTHQGLTGYRVLGKQICREGFKRLYSVGNNRLQRVSTDLYFRIQNDVFCKEKSTIQISLVQWLNSFFCNQRGEFAK